MYVVTAATGQVGGGVAGELLARGAPVRAVARSASKLAALRSQGAEVVVADVGDAAALAEAFAGAEAVFTLIPPNLTAPDLRAHQRRVSEAYATAITRSGVTYVVNLSSVGAQLASGAGPISGLAENERRLAALPGLNVLHLRSAFFMENFLVNVGLIAAQKINGYPLASNHAIAMIATRDVITGAADRLVARDFTGSSTRELLGTRDLTPNELTAIMGRAIGEPKLAYVPFPYADAEAAMTQMGMSSDNARMVIEMTRGLNEGRIAPLEARSTANTTATSCEEFAALVFAPAYHRGAQGN